MASAISLEVEADLRQVVILEHDDMVIPVVDRCGIRAAGGAHIGWGGGRNIDACEHTRT